MDSIAKKGEIIIMDDESCYLVLKKIDYNNEVYLKTVKTGNYLLEEDYPVDIKTVVFLKEIVEEEDCFYDFVNEEGLINTLKAM